MSCIIPDLGIPLFLYNEHAIHGHFIDCLLQFFEISIQHERYCGKHFWTRRELIFAKSLDNIDPTQPIRSAGKPDSLPILSRSVDHAMSPEVPLDPDDVYQLLIISCSAGPTTTSRGTGQNSVTWKRSESRPTRSGLRIWSSQTCKFVWNNYRSLVAWVLSS